MAGFFHSRGRLMVLAFCLASTGPFGANAEDADVDGVCTAEFPCLENEQVGVSKNQEVDSASLLQRGFHTAESSTTQCVDYTKKFQQMDLGAVDKDGDGCSWYHGKASECGLHDGNAFLANEMCCGCGGGSTSTIPRELAVNNASVFVSDGSCPNGFAPITTLSACRASLDLVAMHGMDYNGAESAADWPKGCYRCKNTPGCTNGAWFNRHSTGGAVQGARQICHKNYDPMAVTKFFVGDSDIDFWDSALAFPGSFNVGVGGYTTPEVLKEVDQWVRELDPAWVVLVVGENDLNKRRGNTKESVANFKNIVLKFIADGSRVIYMGTKPEPGTRNLHKEYRYYDTQMRSFAREQARLAAGRGITAPPFVMIDVFPAFKGIQKNEQLYNRDDLHMSPNGYKYWNRWVKQAMGRTHPRCFLWESGMCSEQHDDEYDY